LRSTILSGDRLSKNAQAKKNKKARNQFFKQTFGIDSGKITPFTEKDRSEDRDL
jgi:hypothetical protein